MNKVLKILMIIVALLLFALIVVKIFAAPILKDIAIKETQKFIKSSYNSDIKLEIENVQLKVLDLALLKPTLIITKLSLGEVAKINKAEAQLNLYQVLRYKNLIFKYLKINKSTVFLNRDFDFSGNKKESPGKNSEPYLKKISFDEITIQELDLIVSNKEFAEDSLKLINVGLTLNNLEFSPSPITRTSSFKLISEIQSLEGNGSIKLSGQMKYDAKSQIYSYSTKGEVLKLDIKGFLRILTGEKQGLSGSLSAYDIDFKSSAKNPEDFSKNLRMTSRIVIKEGSLYLLDYIIKAKQVVSTVLPVQKILEESYELAKETTQRIQNPKQKFEESVKSKNSKFTEFDADLEIKDETIFLKNIVIESPIMKVKGKGYNSFDKSMKYNLVASLAKVPVLPIIIRTVKKVPIVFIDVHEFALEKTQELFNILNITDPKLEESKNRPNQENNSFFHKIKSFINDKIF